MSEREDRRDGGAEQGLYSIGKHYGIFGNDSLFGQEGQACMRCSHQALRAPEVSSGRHDAARAMRQRLKLALSLG